MQRHHRSILLGAALGALVALALGAASLAATTVVVTPAFPQGWATEDTRPVGAVGIVADASAPGGAALQLTTDATTAAKAQYMHAANTPLADVTDLSYSTKQNSASFVNGEASYQLQILGLGTAGFTTLVFEPYQGGLGPVTPGLWQSWDVEQGLWWSSRNVTCENGALVAGFGGPPLYTLADVLEICPNAVAIKFGVNIGSNNPAWDVEADLVNFNGTVSDFQLTNPPADMDACKDDGWQSLTDADGNLFKNQGDCVSYANHAG